LKFLVIGGGITGLFLSYYLLQDGHDVAVADVGKGKVRTSEFNAGQLSTRGSFTEVLAKGVVSPTVSRQNPEWLRRAKLQTRESYEEVAHPLSVRSLELYHKFFREEKPEVDVQAEVLDLHSKLPERAEQSPSGTFVGPKELRELGYKGFEGGWRVEELSVHSRKLLDYLRGRIEEKGGRFVPGEVKLKKKGSKVGYAALGRTRMAADAYVVAAGSWSNEVCKPLGYDPMILPARGLVLFYGTRGDQVVDLPSHYQDEGVTVTQHDPGTLRFTGYFELDGFNPRFTAAKKDRLVRAVTSHFSRPHRLQPGGAGVGFRPSTPDQLPVVGRVPKCGNAYIISGACRKGMALAPILSQLLVRTFADGGEEDPLLGALDPARFAARPPGADRDRRRASLRRRQPDRLSAP